jgi:hypothetical protein
MGMKIKSKLKLKYKVDAKNSQKCFSVQALFHGTSTVSGGFSVIFRRKLICHFSKHFENNTL